MPCVSIWCVLALSWRTYSFNRVMLTFHLLGQNNMDPTLANCSLLHSICMKQDTIKLKQLGSCLEYVSLLMESHKQSLPASNAPPCVLDTTGWNWYPIVTENNSQNVRLLKYSTMNLLISFKVWFITQVYRGFTHHALQLSEPGQRKTDVLVSRLSSRRNGVTRPLACEGSLCCIPKVKYFIRSEPGAICLCQSLYDAPKHFA